MFYDTKAVMLTLINRLFNSRHLMVVNTIGCGVFMGGGDIVMQRIECFTRGTTFTHHDWTRTRNMTIIGLALGPINHGWYTFLDKLLPSKTIYTVGKKILADQIIASPFFAASFFIGIGSLEGQSIRKSWAEFRGKFWTVYQVDWCFWPPAQAINFKLIPPQFRVIYVAMATFVWDTFLSYVKFKDSQGGSSSSNKLSSNNLPPKVSSSSSAKQIQN